MICFSLGLFLFLKSPGDLCPTLFCLCPSLSQKFQLSVGHMLSLCLFQTQCTAIPNLAISLPEAYLESNSSLSSAVFAPDPAIINLHLNPCIYFPYISQSVAKVQ